MAMWVITRWYTQFFNIRYPQKQSNMAKILPVLRIRKPNAACR